MRPAKSVSSLIPKRLVASILSLVILLISSFYLFTYFEKVRAYEIYEVHVPVLERTAISLRLNQSLRHTLERAIIRRNREVPSVYYQQAEAFENNQEALLRHGELFVEFNRQELSRGPLFEIERQIIAYSREGDWDKAQEILASSSYEQTFVSYEMNLTQAVEQLSWLRDEYLNRQNVELRIRLILLISTTLLLAYLMWRLIASYNANLKARIETEKHLEAERARSIQSEKLASLGEMAGGIAHEINNPLAIIQGSAQLLEKIIRRGDPDVAHVRKVSERIISTSQRIAKIIMSLRKVAKDASEDEEVLVQLEDVIRDSLNLCGEKIRSKGIEVKLELEDVQLLCKEVEISQVLVNLLNNAYDAVMEQRSAWIRVSSEYREDSVWIAIDDSGPGIPDEVAEKMFNPFFTNKPIGSGTGLGLSVSRTIIESHGGYLNYIRESDFTRFEVRLPATHRSSTAA